jgi:HK97 family phage prohead protease
MSQPHHPEHRSITGSAPTATGRKIAGYAAKFSKRSENLGTTSAPWFEEIAPGAFPDPSTQDCRALFNHDSNLILARSKYGKGSLKIRIDAVGLWYEFESPATTAGNDLLTSLKRGDIDASSFGFIVEEDEWRNEGSVKIRRILKISKLLDVSPVAFPAYQDTSASARNRTVSDPATTGSLAYWLRRVALLEKSAPKL